MEEHLEFPKPYQIGLYMEDRRRFPHQCLERSLDTLPPSLKPSTIPSPSMAELTVNSLLNPDLSSWNNDFIHSIFNSQDATAILSIPLRNRTLVDTYVWQHTADGSYSVKSAYTHCMTLAANMSNTAVPDQNWNIIWKQKVPPKVRSFLWRAAHTCLPTRSGLIQKGVSCTDTCVHCDVLAETHTHLFFVCPKAVSCWELLQLDTIIRDLLPTSYDFSTLLFDLFDRLTTEQQSMVSMILWSLWKNRNAKLWENSDSAPTFIVQSARDSLNEWSYMQHHKIHGQQVHHTVMWSKPPPPFLKCNVDCALFNNNSVAGYGLCIRNSTGQFIVGMSNFTHSSLMPVEAEAWGLLEAIKFAAANDMSSVIFESDCKVIVDIVNSSHLPQNELGDILSTCKGLLSIHTSFIVNYVRRQANEVAHSIARASLSNPSPHVFYDVSSHLYSLIFNEMA
jgi:ribonuclease HI